MTQSRIIISMLNALRAISAATVQGDLSLPSELEQQVSDALALGETSPITLEDFDSSIRVSSRNAAISRVNLKSFVKDHQGKFISIDFTEGDKSRTLNGRMGITFPMKLAQDREPPYLIFYDMEAQAYRSVDPLAVTQIRALGRVFDIIN